MFNIMLIIIILILCFNINSNKIYESLYNNHIIIHKTYIINLDKDIDRFQYIKKQCKQANISKYTRFPAISGVSLNIKNLKNNNILKLNNDSFFNHNKNGRNSLNNSIGCGLSHKNIWNDISNTFNKNILILEYDVIIPPNFNLLFNNISKLIPNDWDIIFLGGSRIHGNQINSKIIKAIKSKNILHNCGLFAYIINSNSAKLLNQLSSPLSTYIDVQLNRHFNKLNCYYIYPNIIKHNYNIESSRINTNYKYNKQFISKANKIQLF